MTGSDSSERASLDHIPVSMLMPGKTGEKCPVVVIGASLGGVAAIPELISRLPENFPAAILVVLHIDAHESCLPQLIAAKTRIPVGHATHGQSVLAGRVYVAPPDRHMTLEGGVIALHRGPKENYGRPAIDPLFRSAAISRGGDVIGVVLTGMLDDGTAGLQVIKDFGGRAVVQAPDDAVAPSMPRSALRYVDVDHCVPLDSMAPLLLELVLNPVETGAASERTKAVAEEELALSHSVGDPMNHLRAIGEPSTISCPECHGSLWHLNHSSPPRFRCHTGHAYSLTSLEHDQSRISDEAMWNALRALQERVVLLEKSAAASFAKGEFSDARAIENDAETVARCAHQLRAMIEILPGSAARLSK